MLLAPGAGAIPDSGPHETVNLTTSTQRPNASAGLTYAARYHSATDHHADPPALRHLRIRLPRGIQIDTSVPARCTASDTELMVVGESACPADARVGTGQATIRQVGLAKATYDTVLYNAKDDLFELVKSGGMVVAVVHTYVRGKRTLDGPIPTCLGGGQPPDGCPTDQFTLLANHLTVHPESAGHGAHRRNYGTTPPSCPGSHRWRTRVTLRYADGSVDRVSPSVRCRPDSTQ